MLKFETKTVFEPISQDFPFFSNVFAHSLRMQCEILNNAVFLEFGNR